MNPHSAVYCQHTPKMTKHIYEFAKVECILHFQIQAVPSYFKNAKATSEIVDMTGYIRTGTALFIKAC